MSVAHLLIGLSGFFFKTTDTHHSLDMWFANIFFPALCLSFVLLMVSFSEQKFLILMQSNSWIFFLFMNCAFDVKSKNSDQIWILKNFSYVYSNSFKVSHFTFKSMIHFS